MNTTELLAHLRGLDVRLWTEGGELKVSAPKGVLTADLRERIRARKEELLSVLDGARASAVNGRHGAIPRVPRDGKLPLSFAQQRLWFLQQLEPELAAYNIPLNWNLRGPLDVGALERALGEIVRRHEVLRTTFPERDGVPTQAVTPPAPAGSPLRLPVVEEDGGMPAAEWRREVLRRMTADAEGAFDLARGPLYRPLLFRLAEDEHVLYLVVHHAIFDGVSIGVLLREMIALYEELTGAGGAAGLSVLPVQYADYAAWQLGALETPELRRQLDHWRKALGGRLPVLELPTDRPRPPVQTYRGDREERPLPWDLVHALERLASEEGATLFMVLLAAYETLLHRYTGQEDLLVGTAINGRDHPDIEDLIGFFVNTLVLRTDVSGDPSFRELLRRVRGVCLDAYENSRIPFERLVDELQPQRNLSYSPIFQTLFLNELDPDPPKRMGALVVRPHGKDEDLEFHIARNDLTFWISADEDELIAWAEYNTDLFDAERILRLLEHYETLLAGVVSSPDRRLSELPLLGEGERERVLVGWNATARAFSEAPVHVQVAAAAARTPEAPAVVFPALVDGAADEVLTYRELVSRARRLARHLAERGARPGSLVGLCVERSSDMLVSMLAVLEAGAAYVPLDPSYPPERIAYMASDAGLSLAVTHGSLGELLPAGLDAVHLERERAAIDARSDAPLAADGADGGAARARMYVIYTSGSTGRPKGVEIEHRSVSNFLCSMAREPGLAAGERLFALTTPSFDISVLELFLPLVVGATVVVAPREATGDGAQLAGLLERLAPDVVQATPATWRLLLVAGWRGDPAKLRVLCGGEALPRELADELVARAKELWNLYGPTETTIWSTVARVEAGEPVTIGRPIANTRVYVLDRHLGPAPPGVPGELWIAGAGLARGYLGRPELTAERFVPEPFVEDGMARMYRTGDLARWRSDGTLEHLGRLDDQVKLRGFRIELGEIEAVLGELPGVRQCVAVVREDAPGDRRLVAYWTREPGAEAPAQAALRARAGERLPVYMVPSLYQELEALPLTPNGKVDRRALLALEAVRPEVADDAPTAPRTPLEEEIAAVWKDVMGLERVPLTTNFFDLGGHSLLLAQVHARLHEHHPGLSILELFRFPTVASLARHLEEEGDGAKTGAAGAAPREDRRRSLAAGRQALLRRRRTREG